MDVGFRWVRNERALALYCRAQDISTGIRQLRANAPSGMTIGYVAPSVPGQRFGYYEVLWRGRDSAAIETWVKRNAPAGWRLVRAPSTPFGG